MEKHLKLTRNKLVKSLHGKIYLPALIEQSYDYS